jgi:chromosome transmission fidelity protein 8
MIISLTLPQKSSPNGTDPALPSALARLGSSEFFLLELQGELEVSGDKYGQLVGRLTIDDTNDGKVCRMSYGLLHCTAAIIAPDICLLWHFKGKPTLRIGHHLLEGKIANLPKPLAILQRCTSTNSHEMPDENGDIHGDDDVDMGHSDDKGNKSTPPAVTATSYAIRTLVRKKIIFSKRPTPMVGQSAKTTWCML